MRKPLQATRIRIGKMHKITHTCKHVHAPTHPRPHARTASATPSAPIAARVCSFCALTPAASVNSVLLLKRAAPVPAWEHGAGGCCGWVGTPCRICCSCEAAAVRDAWALAAAPAFRERANCRWCGAYADACTSMHVFVCMCLLVASFVLLELVQHEACTYAAACHWRAPKMATFCNMDRRHRLRLHHGTP